MRASGISKRSQDHRYNRRQAVGRKILVVDNEAVLVETMAYNLEQAGYLVVTAADGASGLEVARRESPTW